jgi:hypothetical protein
MEMECMHGTMDQDTTETGLRIRSEASVLTHGWMVASIKVNGWITTWRAWVFILGKMDVVTRANIAMIRNMVTAFTLGQITVSIWGCGFAANSTALAITKYREAIPKLVSGRMESVSNGSIPMLFMRYSQGSLISHNTSKRDLKVHKTLKTISRAMIWALALINPLVLMKVCMKLSRNLI